MASCLDTPPSCLGMVSNYRTAQDNTDKELYKEKVIVLSLMFSFLIYECFSSKAPEYLLKPPACKTESFKEVNSGVEL